MKFYCMNEDCPKKIKGYAICTALMNIDDCMKRKELKEGVNLEKDSKSDCDMGLQ